MVYVFGNHDEWELDEALWELRRRGARVRVQPKVLALLFHLARNAERVVPHEELMRELWPGESVTPSSLARALSLARSALESGRARGGPIETVSRRGYRLCARVRTARSGSAVASVLVGRDAALADIERAYGSVVSGSVGLFVLEGEAGIGKTRLIEEACNHARQGGASVLSAWCAPMAGQPPLWPWMRLADDAAARVPALARKLSSRAMVRSGGQTAALASTTSADAAEALRAGAGVFEILDRIVALWRGLAADAPLLVALDDLHWADDSSLRMFQLVCRELLGAPGVSTARIFLIAALRDDEPTRRAPLRECLAAVERLPRTTILALEPLARGDADALARSLWGEEPPSSVVESVWRTGRGNPLFITELVRQLRARGAATAGETGFAGGTNAVGGTAETLPESLRALLDAKIAPLSPPLRELAELAAVVADEPDHALLRECLALSSETLAERLDGLFAQGVLEPTPESSGRLRFVHPLIRDVLLASLPGARRVALHERVATLLEALAGDDPAAVASVAPEVAEHRIAVARAGGPAALAADWAERAGRVALARCGYQEAAGSFESAVEMLRLERGRAPARELELVLQLGQARARANDLAAAADAAEAAAVLARRHGDTDALVRASLLVFVRGPESGGPYDRVVRLLEEAEERTREAPGPLRARVLARLCNELFFTPGALARRLVLADEARALVHGGDLETRLFVGYHTLIGTWPRLRAAERIRITASLAELADESGDPANRFMVSPPYLASRLEGGQLEEVDAEIERLGRKVERLEVPSFYQWYGPVYRAMRALLDGRLGEAERLALEGRDLGLRARTQDAARNFAGQLGQVRFEQGRSGEVEAALRSMRDNFSRITVWRAAWLRALACLGRHDEAHRELETWRREGFPDPEDDSNGVVSLVLLADVCAELAARDEAALLEPALAPYSGENAAPAFGAVCVGPIDLALGRLALAHGQVDTALAYLQAAERAGERLGARPALARARLEHARALVARGRAGDARRAREQADAALTLAEAVGLPDVVRGSRAIRSESRRHR